MWLKLISLRCEGDLLPRTSQHPHAIHTTTSSAPPTQHHAPLPLSILPRPIVRPIRPPLSQRARGPSPTMAEFQNSRPWHKVALRVGFDVSLLHSGVGSMRAMRIHVSDDEVVPDSEEERLQ